jgi:PEP-CTERM motif
MRCRTLVLVALSLLAGSPAWAGPITYHVSVDTSSIAGTAGSLDFNFNPGPLNSQAASLQILSFASDGTVAASGRQTFGDVTGGPLPATLTFDNGGVFNDDFEGFTFGSTLSFDVSLFGSALTSPNGTSTSGSSFGFSMFSDAGGTIPALTNDPTGLAVRIDVLLNGTSAVASFSPVAAVTVPEPGTLLLLATGLIGCFGRRRERLRNGCPASRRIRVWHSPARRSPAAPGR